MFDPCRGISKSKHSVIGIGKGMVRSTHSEVMQNFEIASGGSEKQRAATSGNKNKNQQAAPSEGERTMAGNGESEKQRAAAGRSESENQQAVTSERERARAGNNERCGNEQERGRE